jgi:hypothetical protein
MIGVRVFFLELIQAFPCNDMHYRGATLSKALSDEKSEQEEREERMK